MAAVVAVASRSGTPGTVLLVIGAFGPAMAAAITLRYSGDSLKEWLRKIVRWRVPVCCYAYALGLPVLIILLLGTTPGSGLVILILLIP
jgi:hypothetical protein